MGTNEEQLEVWVNASPRRLKWITPLSGVRQGWTATVLLETGKRLSATGASRERACRLVLGMAKANGAA
jgi:hypothetical protein